MPKNVLKNAETRMDKAIDALKREFHTIRTGRASGALIDNITVDYYGMPSPISQMAQVAVPEPRQLTIKPYDKSMLAAIERAINEANIGLTPNNDGDIIRLNVPALTEERRKELAKKVKALAEDGKVAVRNVRRDANDDLKKIQKNGDITEDELK
ncbi:MAG TPA: ribosome recycling factor, partial [Firmicutes bacterium]|nr:ribosome recycling factor [Bacillota bacterium]